MTADFTTSHFSADLPGKCSVDLTLPPKTVIFGKADLLSHSLGSRRFPLSRPQLFGFRLVHGPSLQVNRHAVNRPCPLKAYLPFVHIL